MASQEHTEQKNKAKGPAQLVKWWTTGMRAWVLPLSSGAHAVSLQSQGWRNGDGKIWSSLAKQTKGDFYLKNKVESD